MMAKHAASRFRRHDRITAGSVRHRFVEELVEELVDADALGGCQRRPSRQ